MTDNANTPEQGTVQPNASGTPAQGSANPIPDMIPRARLNEEVQKRKALEEQLGSVAEALLADVPESFRDLVPNLPPADKVKWLQQAKAKGLFAGDAGETGKPKVPATDSKAPKTAPREEDLSALPPVLRISRALGGGKK